MEYRENRILYDGSSYSRLWEKSAIGILADGPGLLLTDSEVIFCREHRGVEFNGLNDHGSYSSWLTDRIEVNQNLLLETAILEALRVPGNKVVLSENFDSLNLGKSRSWAMRWSSDGHPKKGAPVSEILWFESKDLLNGKVESGESMLKDLLYWCVEVEEMGRIPEVLIIDEEQSVVTYRLSECNPTGVMEKPAKEIIDEISEMEKTRISGNRIFFPSVSKWPLDSIGIPLQGGRQLDHIEAEVITSYFEGEHSTSADILLDLWMRGLNTRSGFKYGSTWRCYSGSVGDAHAPWLVVDPTSEGPENWAEACLSSRLASGVNKHWLYPILDNSGWRYLQISRPPSDSRWSNPRRI
ncbi:MAG: hypothetical protein DWB89_03880 [Candidatus Poseidoniales archaeon]|nr:MAG: hypothetical protein DWB89_03880 [Candidatus Poseidoniales archaeon]